jgi:hypothetical protein
MDWTDVVTHPLGIAGFAIAVMLTVVARIARKRNPTARRLLYGIYGLAAVSVVVGLGLAIVQSAAPRQPPAAKTAEKTSPSMHIDTIEQKAPQGNAVAGVQGDVNIGTPADKPPSEKKP